MLCCYKAIFFDWLVGFYSLNTIYIKRIPVYHFDIILSNNMKVYITISIHLGCSIKHTLDTKLDVVFLFPVKARHWAASLNGDHASSRLSQKYSRREISQAFGYMVYTVFVHKTSVNADQSHSSSDEPSSSSLSSITLRRISNALFMME